ncbi:hypothetical protein FN846DRAFT_895384 [Sphaerosporella brunnea]|uniref:DUF6818 domain-containing protein n=1 Tax=Sphaerosporella brunnea TaxID=1250544 RepID=A0A5J5EFJ5_9PEZI|nr:hypothetical protein FN846DRAFT_895384 [Sphaerosporella brunnea]
MPDTATQGNKRKADSDKAKAPPANSTDDEPESGLETPEPEATPATKKARGRRGKPKDARKFTVRDESRLLDIVDDVHPIGGDMWERVAARYSKRAEEASRKPRDSKYLKKVFQDLGNCKKPTGDPDRPPNVTQAKQIERDIEAEVGMITVNDRDSDVSSDEESLDDEKVFDSDSEPEAPAKPAKQTRKTTVERFRTPREEIKAQNSQRNTVMSQISLALARNPAKDLSAIFETSGLIQVLQNQIQMAEARYNQLLTDIKRLQEKYDEKVAEVQDLKLDLKLLQAKSGGSALSSDPFPWSSPMVKRGNSVHNAVGEGVVL